jgi:hypothetical protein
MASYGQLIDKTSIGSGIAYEAGGDTSTSYWTFVFANSCWFRGYAGTASNIYQPHPTVVTEFWRYSISQQQWVQVASHSNGKGTSTAYRVRCPYNPNVQAISPSLRSEYNGDDSYLFAFKAQTTKGERSRCKDYVIVYNIGADTTYDTTVKGKLIYGRSENIAYKLHANATGPSSYSTTQNWLTTTAMRGALITPSYVNRMISVKSARSLT